MSPRNASSWQGARSYTYRGHKVPSVTTLLQAYPMPWLGSWAAKMVAEEAVWRPEWRDMPVEDAIRHLKGSPWRKRDTAADFGSALHDALAALVGGEEVIAPPGAEAHVEALQQWWTAYRPLPLDSEVQVINLDVGYAGSLDLIAEVYDRRILIDLKTGTIGSKEPLQLAAYRYAEHIFADDRIIADVPLVEACAILHIPRDFPDQWQFLEVTAGAAQFAAFRDVADVYHYHKAHDQQPVGELILPQAEVQRA